MPSKDLLFSVMAEQMTRSGYAPPPATAPGQPEAPTQPSVHARQAGLASPQSFEPPSNEPTSAYEPPIAAASAEQHAQAPEAVHATSFNVPPGLGVDEWTASTADPVMPAQSSAPPSARSMTDAATPTAGAGSKMPLVIVGSVVGLFVLFAIFGSIASNAERPVTESALPEQVTSADQSGAQVVGETIPGETETSGGYIGLDDEQSARALNDSWNTLSSLLDEYGAPRAGNAVPVSGWLKDNFGVGIGEGYVAEEGRDYAARFEAGRTELENLQVSDVYQGSKTELLNLWEISGRRADAYAAIAEDAVSNEEAHWRALQNRLGTKAMKDELLRALESYVPPSP